MVESEACGALFFLICGVGAPPQPGRARHHSLACGLRAAAEDHAVSTWECTWPNEVRRDATSWDQLNEAVRGFSLGWTETNFSLGIGAPDRACLG